MIENIIGIKSEYEMILYTIVQTLNLPADFNLDLLRIKNQLLDNKEVINEFFS